MQSVFVFVIQELRAAGAALNVGKAVCLMKNGDARSHSENEIDLVSTVGVADRRIVGISDGVALVAVERVVARDIVVVHRSRKFIFHEGDVDVVVISAGFVQTDIVE